MSEKLLTWEDDLGNGVVPPLARVLVPMERPAGCLSNWDDKEWEYGLLKSGRKMVFSWKRVMANKKPISHDDNWTFWELCRRYQALLRNELHPSGDQLALSTIFQKTHIALAICDYAIRLGLSSLAGFSSDHFQELLAGFSEGKTGFTDATVTRGRLQQVFSVLDDLHDLYVDPTGDGLFLLNDGVRFACLVSAEDRRAVARNGNDVGQTDDVPEDIVFAHVAAAVEYVAVYSDDILRLGKRWREAKSELPETTRARPGEATAKVARLLMEAMLEGDPGGLFSGYSVDKKRLSAACGTDITSLYKRRFSTLIGLVESWLVSPTAANASNACSALEAETERFRALADRPAERMVSLEKVGLPFSGRGGRFAPWPLTTLGTGRWGGRSLEEVEADLWTACYLLVLAYIAPRLAEGLTIKIDCVVPRVDGFYIRYRTSKGANSEGGSLVERPCPEIVVRAVQVALQLGAAARKKHGADDLFFVAHRHGATIPEESAVRQRLELFGRRTGASDVEGADPRSIVPTELRRFFVTMWVNYYEYAGKYESLRRFLNHEWITTTVRYGLRKDGHARMSKAQCELSVKVLSRKLLDGAGALSDLPKSILPFLNALRVRALPTSELLKEMRDYVEDQGLMLFPMAWGYCIWHHSAGKYAQCLHSSLRRTGMERIDAERSCLGCDGCFNLLRDHVFDPYYEAGLERHTRISQNPRASSVLRKAAKQFVELAARVQSRTS